MTDVAPPDQSGPFDDPLVLWNAIIQAHREPEAMALLRDMIATGTLEEASGAHAQLSVGLSCLGKADEAAAHAAAVVKACLDDPSAAVELASCLLAAGHWADAWPLFERRCERPAWHTERLPRVSRWYGPGLPECLLVLCEDGDGDAIMMARYVPVMAAKGCRVTIAAEPRLLPLLSRVEGLSGAVAVTGPIPEDVPWVPCLSLPGVMMTTPETIPGAAGYLSADPRRAGLWRFGLPPGLRVGLCWASSANHATPWWRSVPIGELVPVLEVPGVTFVNLQVGPSNGNGYGAGILSNPAATLGDYGQTAELVSQLDLVIMVDTSMAHLAGALGVPVWIMLPLPADWRWLEGRSDSPWYQSARLFRQHRAGDWRSVVADLADALRLWVEASLEHTIVS